MEEPKEIVSVMIQRPYLAVSPPLPRGHAWQLLLRAEPKAKEANRTSADEGYLSLKEITGGEFRVYRASIRVL